MGILDLLSQKSTNRMGFFPVAASDIIHSYITNEVLLFYDWNCVSMKDGLNIAPYRAGRYAL